MAAAYCYEGIPVRFLALLFDIQMRYLVYMRYLWFSSTLILVRHSAFIFYFISTSYHPVPPKPKELEFSPPASPPTSPSDNMKKSKLSPAERGSAALNELINGIRTMK